MKTKTPFAVLFFLFCLLSPVPAQNQVIATSQGYQLTENDLRPALELLVFLAQSDLTQSEIEYIVGEAIEEFQASPTPLLESLQELNQVLSGAELTNDPLVLGELRQKLIAEFYKMAQATPAGEMPAYMAVLFRKAPVVAYDPQTEVALTKPDLEASVAFLKLLNDYDEEKKLSPQEMSMAGPELVSGFNQLDADVQKLLASGTILNTILQSNLKTMTPEQRNNVTSHYRTTTGGPPTRTRGGGEKVPDPRVAPRMEPGQSLSSEGLSKTRSMMESLKASGGSDDYWKMATGF
jgi:hypothetical protein